MVVDKVLVKHVNTMFRYHDKMSTEAKILLINLLYVQYILQQLDSEDSSLISSDAFANLQDDSKIERNLTVFIT